MLDGRAVAGQQTAGFLARSTLRPRRRVSSSRHALTLPPEPGQTGASSQGRYRMKRFTSSSLCIAAALGSIGGAYAQAYPERPIRIVCPFPPGGSSDFGARILSQNLPGLLKQSVVIDNRGGAGGNIGTDIVAKAAPDGYTLLATSEGPITVSPSLYPRLPYSPARDLTAITQFMKYTHVV